jgi:hypothetical protein
MSTRSERRIGRPNVAESFRPFVEENLATEPNAPTRELLVRARSVGYAGGKTAFYGLVASARHGVEARGEGEMPAESSYHDLGEADVDVDGGERRRLRFLVSRLAYSGWLEVSLVERDDVECVARALVTHFAAFGGVPYLARFERPKPVAEVTGPQGETVVWNTSMACLAADLGIGLTLRRPRALARRVKEQFFQGRTFSDPADVANKLAGWCEATNVQTPADPAAGSVTPATLMLEERRRLRRLTMTAADLEVREPVFVAPGGIVIHDTHVYSMPQGVVGRMGSLLLGRDRVRIVADGVEAVHPRLSERGARSILPEHRFPE